MPSDPHDAEEGTPTLPDFLKRSRERLGYLGEEGIDMVAGAAAVPPDRWRELERGGVAPSPDELPRIALALVSVSESGPADDPGEVLARLRACADRS
jgi:hypothetical protein